MKFIIPLLLVLILSLIQVSFLPISLILTFVFVMALFYTDGQALFFAFFAGLIFDFIAGLKIGYSSLAFLIISEIVLLYRRKFLFSHPAVIFIFGFIFYYIFQFLTSRPWSLAEAFLLAFLGLLLRLFLPQSFISNEEKIKL